MVVREIMTHDFKMDTFDYFNDYVDTLGWLKTEIMFEETRERVNHRRYKHRAIDMIVSLVKGNERWLRNRFKNDRRVRDGS